MATLVDIEPFGYRANITDGILRVWYQDTVEEPRYLDPRTEYVITVDMGVVAHAFASSHWVALSVTSSDFLRFDRNPTTRGPVASAPEDAYQPADVRVVHDPDRPSYLVLPMTNEWVTSTRSPAGRTTLDEFDEMPIQILNEGVATLVTLFVECRWRRDNWTVGSLRERLERLIEGSDLDREMVNTGGRRFVSIGVVDKFDLGARRLPRYR